MGTMEHDGIGSLSSKWWAGGVLSRTSFRYRGLALFPGIRRWFLTVSIFGGGSSSSGARARVIQTIATTT